MRRWLLAALLFTPAAFGQPVPPPATPALADLDAYARKALADWHAPGVALAVVKDDKVLLARGYGRRILASLPPMRRTREAAEAAEFLLALHAEAASDR